MKLSSFNKVYLIKIPSVLVAFICANLSAETPNSVSVTTYSDQHEAVTSISFTDGLGKNLQSQVRDNITQKYVLSHTNYDEAGRQVLTYKPFPHATNGEYISADDISSYANLWFKCQDANTPDCQDNWTERPNAQGYPFVETRYYNDPLSRVKEASGYGENYRLGNRTSKTWYLSTKENAHNENSNFTSEGFVNNSNLINLDDPIKPFTIENPTHYLTITRTPDNAFSQVMTDSWGRVVKKWTSSNGTDEIISHLKYDILGNVVEEIAPKAQDGTTLINATKNYYNTLGQLEKTESPDKGVVEFTYDDAGRVLNVKDALKRVVTNGYDDLGRISKVWSGVRKVIQNFYDNTDDIDASALGIDLAILGELKNTNGRLVATIAESEFYPGNRDYRTVTLFSYDDEGRIESKYQYIGTLPLQKICYTYSLDNLLVTKTHWNNYLDKTKSPILSLYIYDANGRLLMVSRNSDFITSYNYSYSGQLLRKSYLNKSQDFIVLNYTYDINGWLKRIGYPSGSNNTYFQEIITHDDHSNEQYRQYNGNISSAVYSYTNTINKNYYLNYTYDNLNRLIKTTPLSANSEEFNEEFEYDEIGRFVKKKEGSKTLDDYVYENGNSRLKSIRGSEQKSDPNNYIYDAVGNMICDMSKCLVIRYNWANLPVEFTFYNSRPTYISSTKTLETTNLKPIHQLVMVYDADGNRVIKKSILPGVRTIPAKQVIDMAPVNDALMDEYMGPVRKEIDLMPVLDALAD